MTLEAKRVLTLARERRVTVRAFGLERGMRLGQRTWRDQSLEYVLGTGIAAAQRDQQ
jgi:hypothetical protein